uniref:Uncharacterized protein n=1 Tax=Parascaris univalens TaxID=6257 RepID=A0A914ZYR9_PARUN
WVGASGCVFWGSGKMLNGCDIYNIPSVPKFADLRRVGQGESANDSSSTMGDGNFDVRSVIASIASPSLRNPHSIAKEESIHGSNKEDE